MPTTIFEGETIEQARTRRFREEAALDAWIAGETLCWNCSVAYNKSDASCPSCGKANANVNSVLANAQMKEAWE